jgi:hypothetical protein
MLWPHISSLRLSFLRIGVEFSWVLTGMQRLSESAVAKHITNLCRVTATGFGLRPEGEGPGQISLPESEGKL